MLDSQNSTEIFILINALKTTFAQYKLSSC
jgi:hypothetical protein